MSAQASASWRSGAATEGPEYDTDPELALAAARRGNQLVLQHEDTDSDEARAVAQRLRAWLEPLWQQFDTLEAGQQRQLVTAFEPGLPQLDSAWLARLEQQQRMSPNNALLQYLINQAAIPEYQVRWRWKPNSMAIWDNRATQHYAVMDYPPCHRKMERAGIVGTPTF